MIASHSFIFKRFWFTLAKMSEEMRSSELWKKSDFSDFRESINEEIVSKIWWDSGETKLM